MPRDRFKLNGVTFSAHPRSLFQVFDARNTCVGAWETQEQALHFGLARHPKGYVIACDLYSGVGMAANHQCCVARWASPGPKRTARVPGFEGTPAQARAAHRRRSGSEAIA